MTTEAPLRARVVRAGRAPAPDDPARHVDWGRLRGQVATAALAASALGAVGEVLGTVFAGRLAAGPTQRLVLLLAVCVVGGALLDTLGRVAWAGVVDRAEGRLRDDLLAAAVDQPLAVISEQAVGEVLDRVDDDTHEVGALMRRQAWDALRTGFSTVPMWIVAGLTWWPAWLLFPVVGACTLGVVRPLLAQVSRLKVLEEIAWTDHAAALEEAVNARDDLRTSLGRPYAVRRLAELSAEVHRRFYRVLLVEARMTRRAGLLLHAMLAAVGVVGVELAVDGGLSTARLVTLFLVTTTFVGQIDRLAHHLPDLQAGMGALVRLRQMLTAEPEPTGGLAVPAGPVDVEFRDLHFAYREGSFALRDVTLRVPAGETLALVGRSGSGKSTLASLVSRAVDPEAATVHVGGVDVLDLDLSRLRAAVGVVTQRTEILAGTLAENIALFAEVDRATIASAVAELGLADWVDGLPEGLDTLLGPGGTTLSAGEEQLVAFARLLVRDVRVVVLDEATARMDPLTESRVVAAAERLLAGRTGLLIAHRLSTTARADRVAVLEAGRVVQQGDRAEIAAADGAFARLLADSRDELASTPDAPEAADQVAADVGTRRRQGPPPDRAEPGVGPSLARGVAHAVLVRPQWGLLSVAAFLVVVLTGATGALTGWIWGLVVQDVDAGGRPVPLVLALVVSLLATPPFLAVALRRYPRWWVEVMLRARMSVLVGQTDQHRLPPTPAGEVVARALDADRFARYGDRWIDSANGVAVVVVTGVAAGSAAAGGVLLAVMVLTAAASAAGRPVAGRSAAAASAARAGFGRALVSALDCARTVKLAAATRAVQRHLRRVDGGRIDAAIREHRVQAVLDSMPVVLVQVGVVAAWAVYERGGWDLATAILVAAALAGFAYFGQVAGAVITEAPGVRSWQRVTSRLAGGADLMDLPDGVDLETGAAPVPVDVDAVGQREPLRSLRLAGFSAVHEDGTVGVEEVDLELVGGELVLLLGQIGSGKSSLLSALAGLVDHRGQVLWNDTPVDDAETFLRPGRVAHVAQVPRVLSGGIADNIRLDHDRPVEQAIRDARLAPDVADAGGPDAVVGHRGVRLSGGQVQRLALARALAAAPDLLLADDVSSALDASTEVELWTALRERRSAMPSKVPLTVLGATSKRAALARADRVVVLVDGRVADVGPWSELERRWSHLAG